MGRSVDNERERRRREKKGSIVRIFVRRVFKRVLKGWVDRVIERVLRGCVDGVIERV